MKIEEFADALKETLKLRRDENISLERKAYYFSIDFMVKDEKTLIFGQPYLILKNITSGERE